MHKVPVHLDTQDKFLWSLTFRQVLILFVGGGFAYILGTADWSTSMTALFSFLCGGLCLVLTCLSAFVKIQRRDLDQWLLVAFLHYSSPRLYSWSALEEEQEIHDEESHERAIQEKGKEEW